MLNKTGHKSFHGSIPPKKGFPDIYAKNPPSKICSDLEIYLSLIKQLLENMNEVTGVSKHTILKLWEMILS
jgi:hypothetical protein